jgi:hypothetical protein
MIPHFANVAKMFDKQRFSQMVADDLLLMGISNANIPFRVISGHGFHALLLYFNDRN